MPSIHDQHRQRVRETFLSHPDAFHDHELLELLLFYANPRGDTNPTAHALLERFGSIPGALDALPAELEKVPGVGERTVVLLKAVKALAGRYLHARDDTEEVIQSTRAAVAQLRPCFFGARVERVYLLCLDGKNKSLGVRQVGEGSVNAAEVTTRNVVEAALSLNAVQVVLAHNHVSGLAFPSPEDKLTTQHLAQVLNSVGVLLVDHLIFAEDDVVSLRESGFNFQDRRK